MDALQAIFTRRSIRRYTDEPVSKEDERILLKAAMCAPNTVGYRDWAFIVIRDKEVLAKLEKCLDDNAPFVKDAPMAIVPCGDLSLTLRGAEDYWIQDCSIASENLVIAANAIGLGTTWCGCYPQSSKVSKVARLLKLPRHIVPLCVIAVGHPAETKADVSERTYEESKIHYECWEEK